MIKIVLIFLSVLLFIWFLLNRKTAKANAGVKILSFIFFIFAVIVILIPNISNNIAKFLGVGRGADLLLYVLALVVAFLSLNIYMKNKEDHKKLVKIVRKLAIVEANERYDKQYKNK